MSFPVTLSGVVTRYKGNGRQLGYPTANISSNTDLQDGVYFGYADLADYTNQPALIFIGVPTTMGDTVRRVEAYLLDIPDQDYYGQIITIRIQYFHRHNKTFETLEALIVAMHADEAAARDWHSTHSAHN
jgi:riboflavin kinase/FMN adenylyltransferase